MCITFFFIFITAIGFLISMYVVKHIAAIEMKLINGKDICEKVKEIQLGRIAIGALDAVHL
ncbi:hypothetical protein KHRBS_12500 [Bacillus subtilis subsp. subtilis]|nr:hypothetical protein KHRBS_12500 [Bacillus subtilis subsp. subtilis]